MKKILCTILALVMILAAFTGCGAAESEATEAPEKAPAAEATNAPVEDSSEETVTLKFTTWRNMDEEIYNVLIEKFEAENPGIKVEFSANPDETTYVTTVKAGLQDGSGPDVFQLQPQNDFVTLAKAGVLMDLSDKDFMHNYIEGIEEVGRVDGSDYGFCQCVNLLCNLYDKDVFAEKGYEVPNSWDEFLTLLDKMEADGYTGVSYCGATVRTASFSEAPIMNEIMGAAEYKAFLEGIDSGEIVELSANEDFMRGMETMSQYNKQDVFIDNAFSIDYGQSISLFAQKQTPILTLGSWTFLTAEADMPGINVGLFPIPTIDGTDTIYSTPGQLTVINAATEHPEEAVKWLEFLADPENIAYYCSQAQASPTLQGVTAEFASAAIQQEMMDTKKVELLQIYNRTNTDLYAEHWTAMMENVMINGADPAEEVAKMEAVLKDLNLKG